MTILQKIIKYSAIAFGVFLILSIGVGILKIFTPTKDISDKELEEITLENSPLTHLTIELHGMRLIVQTGETLSAKTNNDDIVCKQENGKLSFIEKDWDLHKKVNGTLLLVLPKGTAFERVDVQTGAGKVEIESLQTKTLSFEIGAGEAIINSLTVSQEAEIDGGAGALTVRSGSINGLDFDMGVGEVNLSVELYGANSIDCGVGELNLSLGGMENYALKVSKGLGSIKIDGQTYGEDVNLGNGENKINVSGGVGAINVQFSKQ
jgi:DUF4097 and DUF4098 domain-containing protein YvlB